MSTCSIVVVCRCAHAHASEMNVHGLLPWILRRDVAWRSVNECGIHTRGKSQFRARNVKFELHLHKDGVFQALSYKKMGWVLLVSWVVGRMEKGLYRQRSARVFLARLVVRDINRFSRVNIVCFYKNNLFFLYRLVIMWTSVCHRPQTIATPSICGEMKGNKVCMRAISRRSVNFKSVWRVEYVSIIVFKFDPKLSDDILYFNVCVFFLSQ